jgi:hypothetical protein
MVLTGTGRQQFKAAFGYDTANVAVMQRLGAGLALQMV